MVQHHLARRQRPLGRQDLRRGLRLAPRHTAARAHRADGAAAQHPRGCRRRSPPHHLFVYRRFYRPRSSEPNRSAAAGCCRHLQPPLPSTHGGSDVPLVVPEVNVDHFDVIESQPTRKRSGGYIVTNPNCCAIGLVHSATGAAAAALWHRKAFCQHYAGCLRSGVPRRRLARYPRQRHSLYQE